MPIVEFLIAVNFLDLVFFILSYSFQFYSFIVLAPVQFSNLCLNIVITVILKSAFDNSNNKVTPLHVPFLLSVLSLGVQSILVFFYT